MTLLTDTVSKVISVLPAHSCLDSQIMVTHTLYSNFFKQHVTVIPCLGTTACPNLTLFNILRRLKKTQIFLCYMLSVKDMITQNKGVEKA